MQALNIDVADLAASSGSSGSAGITSLFDDVVATGPGAASAIIQPNVVTYGKMQQVTALRLLGNSDASLGNVLEIPLGDNLEFIGGVLEVTIPGSGGTPGIGHQLLSLTHTDTLPADAVEGDIIYAGPGSTFIGTYVNAVIMVSVEFDLPMGIYCGLYLGFDGGAGIIAPVGGAIAPDWGPIVATTVENTWLTWDIIDAYIGVSLIISEIGIFGMLFTSIPGSGTYAALVPYPFTMIPAPSPLPDYSTGTWQRKGIGSAGQVLTVVSGSPTWQNLPPIPAEPSYPWQDVPYNAGDFTATGGVTPTWTVDAGDVTRFQYQVFPGTAGIGNNVRIAILLETTTVGGTAPTQLQITLPFNIIGRFAQYISILEAGPTAPTVVALYDDSVATNKIFVGKLGGAVFDTTANQTYLSLEISAVLAP